MRCELCDESSSDHHLMMAAFGERLPCRMRSSLTQTNGWPSVDRALVLCGGTGLRARRWCSGSSGSWAPATPSPASPNTTLSFRLRTVCNAVWSDRKLNGCRGRRDAGGAHAEQGRWAAAHPRRAERVAQGVPLRPLRVTTLQDPLADEASLAGLPCSIRCRLCVLQQRSDVL